MAMENTEEIAYCLASEYNYLNGLECKNTNEKLLGDSTKGIHLCQHPDVLDTGLLIFFSARYDILYLYYMKN